jgi:hypothetical protein
MDKALRMDREIIGVSEGMLSKGAAQSFSGVLQDQEGIWTERSIHLEHIALHGWSK